MTELAQGEWEYGSPSLTRFNGQSSRTIQGQAAPGVSSGEALEKILELADQLPDGIDVEWTGLSYEEVDAGAKAPILYAMAMIAVFLALAALYESWSVPLAIILIVPLGVFGAAVAATLGSDLNNDVYFQVGLLITIGLAAKNAILIVEFAKTNFESGMRAYDSVMIAAQQRLRPILMTSLTFALGVLPLILASGPGSGAQNAIGAGVFGGLIMLTIFVIFYAPFFFLWTYRILKKEEVKSHRPTNDPDQHEGESHA